MEKDAFMVWLKSIHERLTTRGQTQLSYHDLMLATFDLVVGHATPPTTAADTTSMIHSNANGKQIFILIFLHASLATMHAVALASSSFVLALLS